MSDQLKKLSNDQLRELRNKLLALGSKRSTSPIEVRAVPIFNEALPVENVAQALRRKLNPGDVTILLKAALARKIISAPTIPSLEQEIAKAAKADTSLTPQRLFNELVTTDLDAQLAVLERLLPKLSIKDEILKIPAARIKVVTDTLGLPETTGISRIIAALEKVPGGVRPEDIRGIINGAKNGREIAVGLRRIVAKDFRYKPIADKEVIFGPFGTEKVTLGKRIGEESNEAKIYRIAGKPGWLVKIYNIPPNTRQIRALEAFVVRTVDDPNGHLVSPEAFYIDEDGNVGIVEREVPNSRTLKNLFKSDLRADPDKGFPGADFDFVLNVLFELTHAMETAHKNKTKELDCNHDNFLIDMASGHPTIIDYESAGIEAPDGTYIQALVAGDEWVAPEDLYDDGNMVDENNILAFARRSGGRTVESDYFALGILIFQGLFGFHPFGVNLLYAGKIKAGRGVPNGASIKNGYFLYNDVRGGHGRDKYGFYRDGGYIQHKGANGEIISEPVPADQIAARKARGEQIELIFGRIYQNKKKKYDGLPQEMKDLFDRFFRLGLNDPTMRPTPADCRIALGALKRSGYKTF